MTQASSDCSVVLNELLPHSYNRIICPFCFRKS